MRWVKSGTKLFAGLQTRAVRKIPGRAAFAACELRGLQAKARALAAGNVDLVTRKQQRSGRFAVLRRWGTPPDMAEAAAERREPPGQGPRPRMRL